RTSSIGQAEFIVAKHRNGGLDNIRLKFIGHLGKFDNLETFDSPYEFPSKMNETISPERLPSADEAFGSSLNEDDDDVPF
ncbi:MAG: replicative DNA helicase, partial [Flavobacteriaceae bacterium]